MSSFLRPTSLRLQSAFSTSMVPRGLGSMALSKSHHYFTKFFSSTLLRTTPSLCNVVIRKAVEKEPTFGAPYGTYREIFQLEGRVWIHSCRILLEHEKIVRSVAGAENDSVKGVGGVGSGVNDTKVKRKKLKGKRAVVRWLKFFRWKKKKEIQRMTAEEKILYKLKKARKKEEQLVESLKKIEPPETSETAHDPEILTPEEHFYFLKMGLKCKNYVPIGRRGIYQGVILNMHLHWKKHQTLQVVVKTFSAEEVKEIAAELARLSGGIVLDIHEENTIIMYRGKNYAQPPTEIMSPRITLSRKKALDKSKYRDGLRAVRKYIPRLQQDLELLYAHSKTEPEFESDIAGRKLDTDSYSPVSNPPSGQAEGSERLKELLAKNKDILDDESLSDVDMESESEALSDIFESDPDDEVKEKEEWHLYLDTFDEFPVGGAGGADNFDAHMRQRSSNKDADLPDLDEVDRMFLRAASLLKKRK